MEIEKLAKESSYYPSAINPIQAYFSEIAKYPLLKKDEEVALAKRIKKGDKEARKLMISSNLRLVVKIAKERRFSTVHMDLFDKIQAGNIGLMKAVDKFDHERGCKFSTHATYWIRHKIGISINEEESTIRLPTGAYVKESKIYKSKRDKNSGRMLSIEELHEKTGVGMNYIKNFTFYDTKNINSLDCNIKDSDTPLAELVEDENSINPAEFADNHFLRKNIENILKKLNPKEEKVIRMRYGLLPEKYGISKTLGDIGKKINLTKERVRQIEYKALLILKKKISKN